MNKNVLSILVLVFFGLMISCNKDDSSDQTVTPTPPNVLCDGNGSSSYFPLALGNMWEYSGQLIITMSVAKTITANGKSYYQVNCDDQLSDWKQYFRVDSNGDIYELINDEEYLFLPANPTIGQSWEYPCGFDGMGMRRVDNYPFALETKYCNYKNFIFVRDIDGTGDYLTCCTYVQGIGMTTYTAFYSTLDLSLILLN